MIKIIYNTLAILILLTGSSFSSSNDLVYEDIYQKRIQELLKSSRDQNHHILQQKIFIVDSMYRTTLINREITYCGKSPLVQLRIEYETNYEVLRIDFIKVYKPDGRIIYADTTNVKVEEKFGGLGIDDRIAKYYFFSQANIGDVVDIQYRIKEKQTQQINEFQINERLLRVYELDLRNVIVRIHSQVEHYLHLDQSDSLTKEYCKEYKNDFIQYSWFLENPPTFRSSKIKENPEILINSWKDWQALAEYNFSLYDSTALSDDLLERISDSLATGATTDSEIVANIYHFVAREIGTKAFKDESGFIPQPLQRTLKFGVGDCKAKTKLAYHLLKEQNIHAEFILIHNRRNDRLNDQIPHRNFSHIFLRTLADSDTFYVDGTLKDQFELQSLPIKYSNKDIFVFGENGYSIVTTKEKVLETICYENYQINLNDDGMATLSIKGYIVNPHFSESLLKRGYYNLLRTLFISEPTDNVFTKNVISRTNKDTTFYKIELNGKIDLVALERGYLIELNFIPHPSYVFHPGDYRKENILKKLSHYLKIEIELPKSWECNLPVNFSYIDTDIEAAYTFQQIANKVYYEMERIFYPSPRFKEDRTRSLYLIINEKS